MNNQQIAAMLMEGLDNKEKWGYGFRRISVHATNLNNYPYTFTAFGYKDQEGKMFLGLRANVDQCSPMEMKEWNHGTDIKSAWSELMGTLVSKTLPNKARNMATSV